MLIFCVPALAVPVSGTHVARCTLALRLALCSLPVPVIVPPAKSFTKPEPFPLQFPSIAVRLSPLISFQRERSLYAHAVSLSLFLTLAWAMEYLCPSLLVFVTYKSGLANHSNTARLSPMGTWPTASATRNMCCVSFVVNGRHHIRVLYTILLYYIWLE